MFFELSHGRKRAELAQPLGFILEMSSADQTEQPLQEICKYKILLIRNGLISSLGGYQMLRRFTMKQFTYICAWTLILGW